MSSVWIDEKFVTLVGSQLPQFRKQSRTTWTVRCVFCGDSQRHKNKTRGYFFLYQQRYLFKCHNCGVSMSLKSFLFKVAPDLFREYQLDLLRQERPAESVSVPATPIVSVAPTTSTSAVGLPTIASLPDDHAAKTYCQQRLLPEKALSHLYFTDEWTTWIAEMGWSYALPEDHAPRLILPWFDRAGQLQGAQARRIDASGKQGRYVTFKHDSTEEKIYGWDRVELHRPVYVVEGPLDSWFLPNAVAAMGSDLLRVHDRFLSTYHAVLVYDNEPRNPQITAQLQTAVKRGLRVVIWPQTVEDKDINDMVKSGLDPVALVQQHTYQGLRAELEYLRWKR